MIFTNTNKPTWRQVIGIIAGFILVMAGETEASAQYRTDILSGDAVVQGVSFHMDSLSFRIEFPAEETDVKMDFRNNEGNVMVFNRAIEERLSQDGAFLSGVFIHTSASPEGSTQSNINLSLSRAENVRKFICEQFGLSPFNVRITSDGENWGELAEAIAALDTEECPWKDEALEIIARKETFDFSDPDEIRSNTKESLQALAEGSAWSYLLEYVFPHLSGAYSDVIFVISNPAYSFQKEEEGQVAVAPIVEEHFIRDTVVVKEVVEVEYKGKIDKRFAERVNGKRFLFTAKTNIVAIPLINIGVEFPFSKKFSVGANYYYPFIKRNALHKACNELIAYDMDVRYWLSNEKYPAEARLLGHSFGIYGAGGHYDFERDWNGHQGTFFNFGFDWKYAWPVMHGSMHMEFELGLGMIYSEAQPYEVYDEHGKAFRIPGKRDIIRWYGPTRAQFTLCIPFYKKIHN